MAYVAAAYSPSQIRLAHERDAEAICHTIKRSIREVCARDHKFDPTILRQWAGGKEPDYFRELAKDPHAFLIVAESSLLGIVGVGMYNREEGKIGLCYLAPEGLGQGNGSRILEALETQARLDGKSDVFLTSTATAKNFYLRHGFELDGESFLMFGVLAHPMRKRLSE